MIDRAKPAAGSRMRDKATVKRLQMYKSGGKVIRYDLVDHSDKMNFEPLFYHCGLSP